ncbi:hypothetical protein GCM10010275_58330 [Streptomyces litmocidini]|uniref:hypothetical protein n=1 Tax=Streptomyces litmocidini TaxID=67318 RepID=UPI00167F1C5E|nr:hypothetical protein [Streptomyces litmocidini]GGV09865.1 hypothetical protein GCM10010275_58330 [Streptomyces litmocidini]
MTTTGRRALLAAGAAAGVTALAGCTSSPGGQARRPNAAEREAERVARAEAALRLRSVTAARGLLGRYDATLAAHPALAPRLTPLRRAVAAHAKALGEGGTTVEPATATTSAGTAPSTSPAPPPAPSVHPSASASASGRPAAPAAPVRVAADPRAALRELAAAERGASDAHTAALLAAPPEYARLLASVAAACAAHAYLLTEGARA